MSDFGVTASNNISASKRSLTNLLRLTVTANRKSNDLFNIRRSVTLLRRAVTAVSKKGGF